ncbi:GNAT family N-acetyltransferase [Streptomyces purpurascens]|uniref:GNAT family N-acetyltransferase n=1 Tax=Streptomyces purpurascens TaxID=1924 RepID=A0ABZ1MG95_STREF|nr:GNAT family N-acetyltransferase [Streptomyces purpurascens]MCE7052552.1 GNAT family N-acetyltransferase [Streptomyces purpurascens]GHA22905.1 N-acetyltransferase [Streptomyces purpurascens]
MSSVRRALPEDAEEVLRLRQIMIDSLFASDPSTRWHGESLPTLKTKLGEPAADFVAFVVDHPERPGALASLVAGTIDYRIGKSGDPQGKVGFVFSVATDPDARRRGYARACMQTLLEWFRTRGARRVQLTASPEAEPLYVSLGFRPKPDPLLELTL